MANPLKGEIDATIDGKTYTLCLTSNALVQVKTVLGIPDVQHLNMLDVEHARALFWGALQKHHKDVDLLAAGDLLDDVDRGVEGAVDMLARALRFRLSGTAIDKPLVEKTDEA